MLLFLIESFVFYFFLLIILFYDAVITFSDAPLALNYVRENKGCVDVILIEVHMPNMDGFQFLHRVGKEINVPVIMMSHDDATSALMKAVTHGASDYWIKPLHQNQFRILRKLVARKLRIENNPPRKDNSDFASFIVDATMSVPKKRSSNSKEFDFYESDDCYAPPAKEHRVVWSEELHQEFVNAVMQIGLDKAEPKRILEVINIPGLTKENVASHLQKHRLYLKRSSGMTLQQNGMPFPNTISGITESNIVFRLFKMRFSGMTLHVYRRVVCYSDSTLDIDDLVLNSFHQFHLFSNEIFRI
ncbi:two-component response regulator ARR14 isoform X1 [Glycine max]|uniref:Two-component response regulator ARR2 n=2 Tax=Glycine soja TaxID=3848 RepID=A0A0B2PIU3_GLYSO|nr:two-component response regulator ARR14 isoform X1 [Glycine max]KAG4914891.1 hypothetical protein JHK87_052448 [Glycine soja]KHN07528.1 Two-component response regulator ARR2 [Glycine soja]